MENTKIHIKLYELFVNLRKFPFYTEFINQMNFIEKKEIPTAGVNVSRKGMNLYYNPDFLNTLEGDTLTFVGVHEIYHLINNHLARGAGKHRVVANVAADMAVNDLIFSSSLGLKIKETKEFNVLRVPAEYKDEITFERLYDWLMNEIEKMREEDKSSGGKNEKNNEESDKSPGNGKAGDKTPENNLGEKSEKLVRQLKEMLDGEQEVKDFFDVHMDDEDISPELREKMVDEFIETCRRRGTITADIDMMINSLRKEKKNYLSYILQALSSLIGGEKKRTWSKPNRKDMPFKGHKKYKNMINVIQDTSGSMWNKETIEKCFSYIYRNDIGINLFQIDTEVKKVDKIYNKKKLEMIEIKGGGGTTLQPAIDLIQDKYNDFTTLILTDGYTDSLNFDKIKKKVLIISVEQECPVEGSKIPRQIVVKE